MATRRTIVHWVAYAGAVLGVVIAAYALAPSYTSIVEKSIDCTKAPVPHEPIRLRSGVIQSLADDSLMVGVDKLAGEAADKVEVALPEDVPIVEIRVPSYLNQELRDRLEQGGIVIERVPVERTALRPGLGIDVISEEDQYCQARVVPLRLEYEIIIDTEQPE